ncbi:ATP-binding protein [Mesobacillus harenae]|uniref:ATP-binding protein n=1 Tax=Mesobacillus harenae TaxID=2213203 RepID=UPI0015801F3D|nr:ATP-binding protein [Mesobacillus harenae]
MSVLSKNPKLIFEEVKAVKFFLWTFYIILLIYDFFYYFFYPFQMDDPVGFPDGSIGFFLHFILVLILPASIYLVKRGKPELIKYLYLITYIILDFINNLMIFWGSSKEFTGGHIIEIFFILFSPIFVNKRFFWMVSAGIFGKYILFGLLLQAERVIFPLLLIVFMAAISWVLLSTFISYVKAITSVHEDLRRKEKLAVIGQMATAIGHEIKNPLSALRGFIQLEQERNKETDNYYRIMLSEVDRINIIATDLLILGRPKTIVKRHANIEEVIYYVISILKYFAEERNVTIKVLQEKPIPHLLCDENQIKQAFINIIKNSIEAISDGGYVNIKFSSDGSFVKVVVEDDGCGIPREDLNKIGEPFYTLKENGTGLGLMVTKKIIDEHDGEIAIDSEVNQGTIVSILLPL